VQEVGQMDQKPKMEGRSMVMLVEPKTEN